MDEDRIDPARTEATIQRSLDKAKDRRVGAADIVMRMKATACLPNTGCMSLRMCVCDVMEDAADEIEALRKDNDLLDRLMSDIAMAWVRIPHPPRGQVPSALDLAISRAADFTTGLHRMKEEEGE